MSDGSFVYGTAVYRDRKPGEIVVTADGDEDGEKFQGPAEGPPRLRHLYPSPWRTVPGAGWAQDETGAFHVRVYRHQDDAELQREP